MGTFVDMLESRNVILGDRREGGPRNRWTESSKTGEVNTVIGNYCWLDVDTCEIMLMLVGPM